MDEGTKLRIAGKLFDIDAQIVALRNLLERKKIIDGEEYDRMARSVRLCMIEAVEDLCRESQYADC